MTGECVAIVHPLKSGGLDAATDRLSRWAHAAGVPTPHVVTTTPDSHGTEQARDAVAAGADLVLAWGGDGTVRAIAEGLADSGVPLGVVPAGTGNLLARNLGIPLSLGDAATVAFEGADRRIDVLEIGLGGSVTTSTVITGLGMDAVLIDASEELKSAIGPSAYVLNTVRALRHKKMRVGVAVDGGAPRWFSARSVLVANAGGLLAGMDVAPEAEVADGQLHVIVLPLGRPVDWVRTGARIIARRGVEDTSRFHLQGSSAWIVAAEPQPRQVDGDLVGEGRTIQARVRPGALTVRVPRGSADA